ncbi:group II intron maturase [Streptomyces sp. Ag109_O5-1]|nr:group II intron maturase [Streptomyces sp. Ag109_O5-1]
MLVSAIGARMEQVGLRLHRDKTRIVYCKDGKRQGSFGHTAFDFLGFTFRARAVRNRQGTVFTGFGPAVSKTAIRRMSQTVWSWRLHRHTSLSEQELARWLNPIVSGWMNYYGRFYRSELYPLLRRINVYLVRWMRKKYRRLRTFNKAHAAWKRTTRQYPGFFAHWRWVPEF